MNDFDKLAFTIAADSTKQFITVSTAALAFLVAFHKDYTLNLSWRTIKGTAFYSALFLHLASIVAGFYVLAFMAGGLNLQADRLVASQTIQTAAGAVAGAAATASIVVVPRVSVFDNDVPVYSIWQIRLFIAAIVMTIAYVSIKPLSPTSTVPPANSLQSTVVDTAGTILGEKPITGDSPPPSSSSPSHSEIPPSKLPPPTQVVAVQ